METEMREMTNEQIEAARRLILRALKEETLDFSRNKSGLDALCAEVERLKFELAKRPSEAEAAIMRELCEAVEPMVESFGATLGFRNPWEAEYAERKVIAYRATKKKADAHHDYPPPSEIAALERRIAEKVMGWGWRSGYSYYRTDLGACVEVGRDWCPWNDPADALEVLEKLAKGGPYWIQRVGSKTFEVGIGFPSDHRRWADSPGLHYGPAVCLLAAKLMEQK